MNRLSPQVAFEPDAPLTYFAVETLRGETPHDLVRHLLYLAKERSIYFRHVQLFGTFTIGVSTYVRLRVDTKEVEPLLRHVLPTGRGVVSAGVGGTCVRKGSKVAPVSSTLLHTSPLSGDLRIYRGTKIKNWERQFQPAS